MKKLCRNYGGATFPILCLGEQYVITTPFPTIQIGFFLGNMEAVHDQHSGRFHQDISQMGKRYSG